MRQLLEDGFQEDGKKAVRLYTKAITKDKNNVEAYWRRGDEFYKMKQYDKSISDLNQAIAIDSAFINGYLFGDRGQANEATGDLVAAIHDYTTAISLCKTTIPTTPRETFYFYRGRANLKFGDTLSANRDTDSALHYWDYYPRARYQKGRLEVIRGGYKSASKYFSESLTPDFASDKEFVDDVFYYGLLKYKTGDTTYCDYWKAAARYNYPKAIEYLTKYCATK